MGNWSTLATTPGALSQTRTHNKANEITAIAGPTGVPAPTYDLAGNMTTAPSGYNWTTGIACKWDAWNRVVQAGSSVYVYDAMSRRIKYGTIDAYYDTQWRAVEERSSTSVTAQYTWSPFDRWTLMRRKRSVSGTLDETRWGLKDDLNTVAFYDQSNGGVLARMSYDAFGVVSFLSETYQFTQYNTDDWNFLFHGEFFDGTTGWYNYGYRYYNIRLGRWLSRDPAGEKGGLNLYEIVGNDLINNIDFYGLEKKSSQPKTFTGQWFEIERSRLLRTQR